MDNVAIYARVSTVELQEFDRQINDLKSVIYNHGYKDNQITIFAEKISGYKKERPELNKLLSEVDKYKCIYISEISRLGRNPSHTRKLIDDLTDKNIPIYIQSIGQSTLNPDGSRNGIMSIILQVLIEFAHSEAETMKTRMKSGKKQAVSEGKVNGNNQAYGYANKDKMLVIDEDESLVIEKIYQLYLEDKGTKVIAGILNDMNIPTRLAKTHKDKTLSFKTGIEKSGADILWDGNTILTILKNPIYKGERRFKGEIYKAPIIITEDIWEQVNDKIKTKTHRNYLTSYTYLLKDLCYCGKCGRKYFGVYNEQKRNEFYKCASSLIKGGQCGNGGVNINLIESAIFHQFIQSDNLMKYLENPNDILKQIKAELIDLETQFKIESNNLKNKETELSRLLDLYLSSNQKKEIFEKKENEISNEIEALNKKIKLIKKQILDKKISISNFNKEEHSKELLINAKDNRTELSTIFKQVIHKVHINKINKRFTLLTIEIKLNGIVLSNTLKLILDIPKSQSRGRSTTPKSYEYIAVSKMENEPIFKDSTLLNDFIELENEIEHIFSLAEKVKNKEGSNIIPNKINIIPNELWLSINSK